MLECWRIKDQSEKSTSSSAAQETQLQLVVAVCCFMFVIADGASLISSISQKLSLPFSLALSPSLYIYLPLSPSHQLSLALIETLPHALSTSPCSYSMLSTLIPGQAISVAVTALMMKLTLLLEGHIVAAVAEKWLTLVRRSDEVTRSNSCQRSFVDLYKVAMPTV